MRFAMTLPQRDVVESSNIDQKSHPMQRIVAEHVTDFCAAADGPLRVESRHSTSFRGAAAVVKI
jgi:hypothetical protein